ncbi:MAG: hypothetical protein AAF909_07240, partial [Pseudomonadota bacterium]
MNDRNKQRIGADGGEAWAAAAARLKEERISKLKSAAKDVEGFHRLPDTPQTSHPAHRLAFVDDDFMRSEETRGVRLQLELLKPELILQEHQVRSTFIFFGGARIPEPGEAAQADTAEAKANLEAASVYYDEARRFARRVAEESLKHSEREFVVTTGGGPGIM